MTRRRFFQSLVAVMIAICLLVLPGVLSAQGNSDSAFERVKEVQERHTNALMAREGVVGTAVGLGDDGQPAVLVLLERGGVPGIPVDLDGVPVRHVVTGTIYALARPPAPGIPAAPSNLAATVRSSTQIDLAWTDNASNEKGFKIERKIGGGTYTEIATVGANITSYSNTGLSASTMYTYQVRAYNKSGNSTYSNEAIATTAGPPSTVPAAPTGLVATVASSTQINLDWADNPASDQVTRYDVYRSQTSGAGYALAGSAIASNYSDGGRAASTTYYYVVKAVNVVGESGPSNEASATTPAGTMPPLWQPRPVPIGVSTGHPNITAGTIGCRVTKGGLYYALSNNHVYADENRAVIGDNVLQPGAYDGGQNPRDMIGKLADFQTIVFSRFASNTIDAAIAECSLDKLGNSTPAGSYGTPSSTVASSVTVGLPVMKHGRTTGLQYGEVYAINATVNVGYDQGTARFINQIVITPGTFSAGGDSGSLIVTQAEKKPVGLLFAGSTSYTIANPIGAVLTRFGVTIDGQ